MTFETEFYSGTGNAGFKTVESASAITQAYMEGENVIIHFPPVEHYGNHDSYTRMIAYAPAFEVGGSEQDATYLFAGIGNLYAGGISTHCMLGMLYSVDEDANGKLDFHYYID